MAIHARLAHVGVYAHDKPKLEKFYSNVLGLVVTDSGTARSGMSLTFMSGNPSAHHQLVLVDGRPDTAGFNPIQQISFMVDSLSDLKEVHGRAISEGCSEMRVVTHGNAWSCYFKDPEGNVVEAYLDTPWHVPQPHGASFDITAPEAEIVAWTEAHCRETPGFMPIGDYQKQMAQRLAN